MTRRNAQCPGPVSRRSFLEVGSLAMAGLGLADFLRVRARATPAGRQAPDTAVILLWLGGGAPQTETYDMKPGAPVEYRGEFKPVPTVVPGMDVCELLPLHAKVADRFSVIRSISHPFIQHGGGAQQMLTGRPPVRPDGDAVNYFPAVGSVVSKMRERVKVGVPNYVVCTDEGTMINMHMGAYVGAAHTPFQIGANFVTPELTVQNLALTREMETQLEDRITLLRGFDEMRREIDASGDMVGMDAFNQLAIDMLTSDKSRKAFDLMKEDPRERDRYGRHAWGQRALLARRLVEAGSSFVTVEMNHPTPGQTMPADTIYNWDTHSVNANHFTDCRWKMPYYDQAISALVEDLYLRGLDKKVMLVVTGEFGRTPQVEYGKPGRPGRGHHCAAMSVLVAGGGMRMGQIIGATDSKADHPVDRPLKPADLWATVYRFLGIDHEFNLTDNIGRPMPILPGGEPIRELLPA
ncbi:MAG: DUF1501 domain-containing protein [Isosphaeraceae bacterium]|nr:DUF1501 domain-containing protein [Isosphaeraceae bacterium]